MSGTNDDFEDDDLEPVWASPDDAEDDWDDSFDADDDFDDGDEFAAESGDDFGDDEFSDDDLDDGAAAADDPFDDDEYDDEFGDEGGDEFAAADDEFDDEFESSYDDEGEDGGDYDDEDYDGDGADEDASAGGDERTFIQKQMPNIVIAVAVLGVGYVGYLMLGGGQSAPPPQQRLPNVNTQQVAQNTPPATLAPAVPGNAPTSVTPGQPVPGGTSAGLPSGLPSDLPSGLPSGLPGGLPGQPAGLPSDLANLGQSSPLPQSLSSGVTGGQGGIGDLAGNLPGLDSIPAPDVSRITSSDGLPLPSAGGLPSGGIPQGLAGLPQPSAGGLPSGGALGGEGLPGDVIPGASSPIDIASLGQAPGAVSTPTPSVDGTPALPPPTQPVTGISPALGLSTDPLPSTSGAANPTPPPPVGVQLPSGLSSSMTQADFDQVAATLRSDLRDEIQAGIGSLRSDLRDTVESVFEEERVLLEAKINGLEREIDLLRDQQQLMTQGGATSSMAVASQQGLSATESEQPMMAAPDDDGSSSMMTDASEATMEEPTMVAAASDSAAELEAAMNEALGIGGGTEATEPMMDADTSPNSTAGTATSSASTPVANQPAADRPPVIRRSAAPRTPPPVPAQKPGMFLAQGQMMQPGPFGARLPVQMAQAALPQPAGAYQLRGVSAGTAWVSAQDSGTVLTVNRGDFLPGLGRVTEIRRSFSGWEVVTERGIIRQ
ncbi:MAG: hypothetical protein AAF556_05045 [Pseudomonadota bacterium]